MSPIVPCTLDGCAVRETQTITVSHTLPTMFIVNQARSNIILDQSSEAVGSQTPWMVLAILFIIIAVVGFALSALLGFLLYKIKMLDKPNMSSSKSNHRKLPSDGELSCHIFVRTVFPRI